jgi:hypothetical protein
MLCRLDIRVISFVLIHIDHLSFLININLLNDLKTRRPRITIGSACRPLPFLRPFNLLVNARPGQIRTRGDKVRDVDGECRNSMPSSSSACCLLRLRAGVAIILVYRGCGCGCRTGVCGGGVGFCYQARFALKVWIGTPAQRNWPSQLALT